MNLAKLKDARRVHLLRVQNVQHARTGFTEKALLLVLLALLHWSRPLLNKILVLFAQMLIRVTYALRDIFMKESAFSNVQLDFILSLKQTRMEGQVLENA